MGIRKYKPTTPGRRGASVSDFAEITRDHPEKSLVRPLHGKGGRNAHGRITTRHKGGGHKRAYRVIDFRRHDKDGVNAKVAHIEYDPNRTANIALLHYLDGEKRYIVAPQGLSQGDVVESGANADIKPGNNLPLRNIPSGTVIHAVELRPGGGAKLARSAGSSIQLLGKEGTYASLRMPSGEIRRVDVRCRATVGEVGNAEQANINWGKAGRMRWKGKRPTVRGVVMNAADHPHGGGDGGRHGMGKDPRTPWGQKTLGYKTRSRKADNKMIAEGSVVFDQGDDQRITGARAVWNLKTKPEKGWIKIILNRLLSFSIVIGLAFLLLVSLIINGIMEAFGNRLANIHIEANPVALAIGGRKSGKPGIDAADELVALLDRIERLAGMCGEGKGCGADGECERNQGLHRHDVSSSGVVGRLAV